MNKHEDAYMEIAKLVANSCSTTTWAQQLLASMYDTAKSKGMLRTAEQIKELIRKNALPFYEGYFTKKVPTNRVKSAIINDNN